LLYSFLFLLLISRRLGEAYLRILNPDAAVDALLRAHELDRTNARLRGRIGRAMVATHEYHRAVEFYEQAIREVGKAAAEMGSGGIGGSGGGGSGGGGSGGGGSGGGGGRGSDKTNAAMAARARSSEVVSLSHDLAKLYLKLGRAEASSRVLSKVMHEAHRDTTDMRQDVATLMLLAEVHQQQQQGSAATTSSSTSTSEVLQTYVKASAIQVNYDE
jgi:tetratricopeptide (TPR) repeat protein